MEDTRNHSQKDTALEALRGIAALVVVFQHNRLAFLSPDIAWPQLPQIVEIFFAGGSAVMFFFVLSGYVLTRKFVEIENNAYLLRSVAKRYFRLLGPGLLSCLLSAALFQVGAYHYAEVATAVKSAWLSMFGYSIPPDIGFQPSFGDALRRGAFDIYFIPYHQYYNSPLWTMYFETIGSFLIFGLAFCAVIARRFSEVLMGLLWAAALAASFYVSIFYAAFVCGLGLTLLFSRRTLALPSAVSIALIIVSVILLSFQGPVHEYSVLAKFGITADWSPRLGLIGAVCLIVGVELNDGVRKALSGRIGAFLGQLSFPVYLVHFLVLASLGCFVWIHVNRMYGPYTAFIVSFCVSVAAAVIAALPMSAFDRRWTAAINRIAAFIIKIPNSATRRPIAIIDREKS